MNPTVRLAGFVALLAFSATNHQYNNSSGFLGYLGLRR